MYIALVSLACFLCIATALPLLRVDAWFVRIFDFPRAQIAIGGVVVLAAYLYVRRPEAAIVDALFVLLLIGVTYQGFRMLPYTIFWPKEVQSAPHDDTAPAFTLMVANVLMENRASDAFIALVREVEPDILIAVETDDWWERTLREIEPDYPYVVKRPLDNTYGMLLYSRFELVDPEIKELVETGVPSIHTRVRLPSGFTFSLHCIHPKPPFPSEDDDTTERDAELLLVGKTVRERGGPAVVAGDLNDVAWSHSTHLFQRVSGMLDPRVGRGMFSTFDARNPLLRWPLDHVFHTDHFKLGEMRRLRGWGSDHFPILVRLHADPGATLEQETPASDRADRQEAAEKIDEGRPRDTP